MKLHGEEIKLGDRVWHILLGWQTVSRIDADKCYPIQAEGCSCNESGHESDMDKNPSIFWDELHITPPPTPKREIDWSKVPENTLVRVWDRDWENHRIAEYYTYDTVQAPYNYLVQGSSGHRCYKHCELHESVTPLREWYK